MAEPLGAREEELVRLRMRAERAEEAVARVLALCEHANKVTVSARASVYVTEIRAAIGGRR